MPVQLRRDFGPGFALHPRDEARIRENSELSVSKQHKIDGVPFNPAKVRTHAHLRAHTHTHTFYVRLWECHVVPWLHTNALSV